MQTLEQFGQTIKAKYPQYNDIADAELGQRMLAKFPQYQDMVDTNPAPQKKGGALNFLRNEVAGTPQEGDPGFLGSIFQSTVGSKGIIGVVQNLAKASAAPFVTKSQVQLSEAQQNLADATLAAIKTKRTLTDPKRIAMYDQLIGDNLTQLREMGVTNEQLGKLIPTQKENLGAALNAGSTIASFGLPGAAKVGVPKAIAAVAGMGAVSGAGDALSNNKDIGDVIKQSLVSGLISGGTYGVLLGAGKVAGKILEKAPEALMTDAMRVSKKVIQAGQNPAKLLVEEGQFGGMNPLNKLGSLYSDTQTAINDLNTNIIDHISNEGGSVATKDILQKAVSDTQSKFGTLYSLPEIKAVLKNLPIKELIGNKELDRMTLNEVRSQLGSLIGDSGFRTQSTTLQKNLLINVWKATKNTLLDSSADKATLTDYFARETKYIKANQAIASTMATLEKNTGVGMKDLIYGVLGGMTGGLKGALELAIGHHLLNTPDTKILTAQVIDMLNRGVATLPTDNAGKISKAALIRLIGNASSEVN